MEEHLIARGVRDSVLEVGEGAQIAGEDLLDRVRQANRAKHLMSPLIRKVGSADVVEQAAIAGALNPDVIPDAEKAGEAAAYIARRLDTLADAITSMISGITSLGDIRRMGRVMRRSTSSGVEPW